MPGLIQGIIEQGGRVYAKWDPSKKGSSITLSNGNLTAAATGASSHMVLSTIGVSSGKYYWEVTIVSTGGLDRPSVGIAQVQGGGYNTQLGTSSNSWAFRREPFGASQQKYNNSTGSAYGVAPLIAVGQVISIALDMGSGTVTMYKDGVDQGGTMYSGLSGTIYAAVSKSGTSTMTYTANFGQNSWAAGTSSLRTTLAGSGYTIGLYV